MLQKADSRLAIMLISDIDTSVYQKYDTQYTQEMWLTFYSMVAIFPIIF